MCRRWHESRITASYCSEHDCLFPDDTFLLLTVWSAWNCKKVESIVSGNVSTLFPFLDASSNSANRPRRAEQAPHGSKRKSLEWILYGAWPSLCHLLAAVSSREKVFNKQWTQEVLGSPRNSKRSHFLADSWASTRPSLPCMCALSKTHPLSHAYQFPYTRVLHGTRWKN